MKKVIFSYIHLENFGRFTEPIQSKLGHRTIVSGQNGTGKSTLKRMIQYVLGTKDESGKEISGIRPHDESGVDIDGLTTVAELTVSVDGAENTLKRTCFQEKNRQGEYTGKDNLQYYIDDVKKGTKKAYDEFVQTVIPEAVCISAQELLMKDTAGRRAMLEVFSKHDTESIIAENPDFEPLRGKLKANTVADLKKACRDKIKEKTQKRDTYPALINEVEKQKVDIDLTELELLKNSLNEQINEVKVKQANVDKQFEEYDKLSSGIIELKCELSDLERKVNEENIRKRRELEDKIADKKFLVRQTEKTISDTESLIELSKKAIEEFSNTLQTARDKWKAENERVFDENILICSYCGQEYPAEKKEQLKAKFESHKANELSIITENGNTIKSKLDKEKEALFKLEKELPEHKESLNTLNTAIADLEKQLSELPESIDISDREDVKKLKQQISDKEQVIQKANSGAEIRQQLQDELEDLQRQKAEVVGKMNLSVKNNGIDERVAELKKQQLALSQEIADIDKELDLLKQFERKKAELLEDDINKNCDYIQFKMSEVQQNGELKDVCQILVNGESYDRNLNFSSQLLVHVDICRMFQRLYDVELPILLDNAESISVNRLPDIPNQLIMFRVPYIPEKPLASKEGMAEEEWQKTVAEWEEEKKRLEEYYSELRIECLEC